MTSAEYIAEFLARVGSTQVFTLTGGACAFMIDAVGLGLRRCLDARCHEGASRERVAQVDRR